MINIQLSFLDAEQLDNRPLPLLSYSLPNSHVTVTPAEYFCIAMKVRLEVGIYKRKQESKK